MKYKRRRTFIVIFLAVLFVFINVYSDRAPEDSSSEQIKNATTESSSETELASSSIEKLEVKGRAPKTGYERSQFSNGWSQVDGCDVRNIILSRDMTETNLETDDCIVLSGNLFDPYTAASISFLRGSGTSTKVQIDHVVALSDAWQKGAQQLSSILRNNFANDQLNLLAVDGSTNQKKGDGDAATWLPPYKTYRCAYVARQISVKIKYSLWITQAEKDAMLRILNLCPGQVLPIVNE